MEEILASENQDLKNKLIREVRPPFLVQVALSALLHQGLQVVGILLHPGQKVVHDVARLVFLVDPLDHPPVIMGVNTTINQSTSRKS